MKAWHSERPRDTCQSSEISGLRHAEEPGDFFVGNHWRMPQQPKQ